MCVCAVALYITTSAALAFLGSAREKNVECHRGPPPPPPRIVAPFCRISKACCLGGTVIRSASKLSCR
uniref:Putative secreted protein n=1 Tax=Anopheles darlingi TaxID=43151 RepID=A0A2M4DR86_ANODA